MKSYPIIFGLLCYINIRSKYREYRELCEINEDDCIPVSRAGIEIETGVEKEEEEEWHLVNALKLRTESMEKGATASGKATIPVPTSSRRISYYADVYQTHKWKKPSTYVKFSLPVEECIGCLYCMDEKDDIWLAEHKQKNNSTLTEDQFEEIMQHFENVAKNKPQLLVKKQLPSWQDCEACLSESLQGLKSEAEKVFPYWRNKRYERLKQYQKNGPLMFEIKTQEGKDEEDHPWTCFRRRELKPIRRTRRTETASFDKLRKIRKDIHSGRQIMVHVTMREKTKKQKIELDRKIFEKECTARELRKKLGIRNEISHEQPKRSRKSSLADLLGVTKTKSGIKLSKKDDEYPMTDITDYPYLIQRKQPAASYFRKFDSLKPTDRNSISCTAFRSRFGRGGRRRRIIDRLDVFAYRRIRETNERYKYDSDGLEDVFSDDELNQLNDEEKEEDYTENIIRFHLFKDEDYQNLGVYRRIQKEKQNSPTKQQSSDALSGNNIPAQNPQHTPLTLANAESRQQILEQRIINESRFVPRSNTESRTASPLDARANQDSRQKIDTDPRANADSRINMRNNGVDARASVNNISNVDPRTFIDPRSFNGLNRNQSANSESNTSRDPRLNPISPSTPRLVNSVNNVDPRAHNGLILRPTVTTMNRDNLTNPYRRPIPKNVRIDDSNNNNSIGVTNVVSALNGLTPASLTGGSNNTSISAASSIAKNHQNTSISQINSPARPLSSNNNTNGQGNGDGLARTLSNPGMVNNAGQLVGRILMNTSGQMLDPSKISAGLMNSSQLEAQKINAAKQQRNRVQPSAIVTPEQLSQLSDSPTFMQEMQKIISLKTSSNLSTSTVSQPINNQNSQRQPTVQTTRQQNITVPSVGSNVPSNSTVSQNIVLPSGMVQSPSPSVIRQNNIVQSSGSSGSVPPNFTLANTINVNQNGTIGTNGSQQAFVHPIHSNGIVNINNMSSVISNGQSTPVRTINLGGSRYALGGANGMVLNGIRPISGNMAAAAISAAQRHQLATNGTSNLRQMRPMMRQNVLNGAMLSNLGYDLILPSQSPRQNNASVTTSNGGNNSVGTPSPQPQAEQRTVR
ncbi:enhancer of polycomb-like protein 1 [Rhizophagus clarus]|uniref:Enhancer of polycomb-like protein n=1 Tax=Rhizophagus clarus TaxID=94130 RepID=A0A8H3M2U4_9GLOM|nr:enhancer of polycomb-like protein 1 [Rhizophagus clarus]